MNGMGFELEDLGGGSYAVNSVPAGLEGMNPVRLVQDMVSSAVEKGVSAMDEINQALALSLARQAAIPHGQVLSNEEMEGLVNGLFACENVNYTPDGKSPAAGDRASSGVVASIIKEMLYIISKIAIYNKV